MILDFVKLKEYYVRDLQKPGIDMFERARIIQSYMDDRKWSIRELSRQMGIPRSTVEDWLLPNRIEQKEYNGLLKSGYSPTQLYKALREKKKLQPSVITKQDPILAIDVFLSETKVRARNFKRELVYTAKTLILIEEAVQELHRLSIDIALKEKKK